MKHKIFIGLLLAEAVICIMLCFAKASFTGVFSAAMAFPFEQIGMGLRMLSLSSGLGNAFAIALYAIFCLSPIVALGIFRKGRKFYLEDGLLCLLCAVLFAVMYFMINPGLISTLTGGAAGLPVGKAVLGVMVYSVLCGYLVLRILRLFSVGGTKQLERYMTIMLGLMNVLFVYIAFGASFGELLDSITSLQAGNVGNEHLLKPSYIFLTMQFIVNALPYVLDILVVFAALRLLSEMRTDRYSIKTVQAAESMSRLCAISLAATSLTNIAFNLFQLLFAKSLMVINSTVQLPVFSILFVLAALLLTRFVAENKQLKDENDQFI